MTFRAITISGEVGSGKSSIASALITLLSGWRGVNTGQRFREFCSLKGMSIQQVSLLPDEVHKEFDVSQLELLRTESNIVVEGRLAGWLTRELEYVFRVFCYAPFDIRVERYIVRDQVSISKAISDIEHRDKRDFEKFKRIYGMSDYRAPHFYHLRLDTSNRSPIELARLIIQEAGLAQRDFNQYPRRY